MSNPVLVCVDGSDPSLRSVRAGLRVVDPALDLIVVTVIEAPDAMLVTGTGMAGGTMSDDEFRQFEADRLTAATQLLDETARALDLTDARTMVVAGQPGAAICALAESEMAGTVVIGSRGRGGFRRAVLGSVSDHVVRHAPCPVVVVHDPSDQA